MSLELGAKRGIAYGDDFYKNARSASAKKLQAPGSYKAAINKGRASRRGPLCLKRFTNIERVKGKHRFARLRHQKEL